MKKLFLIVISLISVSAYADMNKICVIVPLASDVIDINKIIEEEIGQRCKKNNILKVRLITEKIDTEQALAGMSAKWCRFDRNTTIKNKHLSCVLYSTKPRVSITS